MAVAPVENRSIVTIVVEAVDEPLVTNGLRRVSAPHDALVKIRQSQTVIFSVELEQQGVQAPDGGRRGNVSGQASD